MNTALQIFINKCNGFQTLANGYLSLVNGTPLEKAIEEQDKSFNFFKSSFHEEIISEKELLNSRQVFLENRHTFLEMIHGFYVQAWSSFLDNIFENMLEKHFSGTQIYKIQSMPVQFISIEDTPDRLLENIKYRVSEHFSNQIALSDKIKVLEKSLEINISPELKNNIKKHIVVRNVIQHNQGELRERDLRTLGSSELIYPFSNGELQGDYYNPEQIRDYRMKKYIAGDALEIDVMTLDQVHLDFIYASKSFFP